MTDYTDLAERLVKQGIGSKRHISAGHHKWHIYSYDLSAEKFVTDGRIVLAAIIAAAKVGLDVLPNPGDPTAIIMSCLEKLEFKNKAK